MPPCDIPGGGGLGIGIIPGGGGMNGMPGGGIGGGIIDVGGGIEGMPIGGIGKFGGIGRLMPAD